MEREREREKRREGKGRNSAIGVLAKLFKVALGFI